MVIVVSLSSMCQEYEGSGFLAYLQTNKLAYNKFIENFAGNVAPETSLCCSLSCNFYMVTQQGSDDAFLCSGGALQDRSHHMKKPHSV